MESIREGLADQKDSNCCGGYFEHKGVDIEAWTSAGGAPYFVQRKREGSKFGRACGFAQKAAPFTYVHVNWDCFQKTGVCSLASFLLHEMGHLARKDTHDNEPAGFFEVCDLGCADAGDFQ
jgi:hypothetical protein